jgi:hypothetical protein
MPTFRIKDTFRITGRGHVLSGYVGTKEVVVTGDKVLITVDHEAIVVKIIGVSLEKEDGHFGLLISFKDYDKLKGIDLNGMDVKIIRVKERQKLATGPIEWTGDLLDDCTARWAGLMLRAEWMHENYWWWTVYDMLNGEVIIDSSNNYNFRFVGGEMARKKAEETARTYLSIDK